MLILFFTGCTTDEPQNQVDDPDDDSPVSTDSTKDSADSNDSASTETGDSVPEIIPDETVDVVVVGSGPAGCAAALEAQAAGASVVLFEREPIPGLGVQLGGLAFAVGTGWQDAAGLSDSVEIATAEWSTMTGASGESESVQRYLTSTAATVDWLAGLGAIIEGPLFDYDAGSVPRLHTIGWPDQIPYYGVMASYAGETRLSTEVIAPWIEDGQIRGVRWHDRTTDAYGYTGAGAVVIATGGFLRNRDKVNSVAPELADRDLLFETNPSSDGGGLPFLDAVNAGSLAPEQIGLYVHAIPDPEKTEGEALVVEVQRPTILVGEDGTRFIDETLMTSFDLFEALPPGKTYAVTAGKYAANLMFMRPAYNWADVSVEEFFTLAEVEALGSPYLFRAETLADAATMAGLDPEAIQAELDAYNTAAATGTPDPVGRYPQPNEMIEGDPYLIIELTPALAKAFGGVATDVEARVLDTSGEAIPGLYAAGEVAGMIVGGGGGDGFSGSVSACYAGGRTAGTNAAAWAKP